MTFFEPVLFESDIFSNPFLGVHLRLGRFFGLFSEVGQCTESKARWRLIFVYGFVLFMTLQFEISMIYCSSTFSSFEKGCLTWATTIFFFSISFWMLSFFWWRQKIAVLVEFVNQDLNEMRCRDDFEAALLKKASKFYVTMTKGTWIFCVVVLAKFMLETVIKTIITPDYYVVINENITQTNPLRLFAPYHKISNRFFIAHVMPFISVGFAGQLLAFVYTFAPAFMCYITFKLDVLAHRIETMNYKTVMPSEQIFKELNEQEQNYWRAELCKSCTLGINRVRLFAEELQSFMKGSIFVDFLSFSIQFGFAFHSLATSDDVFPALAMCVISFCVLYIFHWQGSIILHKCDVLGLAIYSCDWYNYSLDVQKLIYTMMFGIAEPIKIRALIIGLNKTTFVAILRAGVSYFNVVNSRS